MKVVEEASGNHVANGKMKQGQETNQEVEFAANAVEDEKAGCYTTGTYHILLCLAIIAQTCVVSGYHSSIQTTLQKQFNISSSDFGLITSSYEIACILTLLIISYAGHRQNRARLVGVGSLLVSLGATVSLVPFLLDYFLLQNYLNDRNYTSLAESSAMKETALCRSNGQISTVVPLETSTYSGLTSVANKQTETNSNVLDTWLFVLGRALMGVGAAPMFTIGFTYLYDNIADRSKYPIYSSIVAMCTGVGPAIGFLLGLGMSTIYVIPWDVPAGMTTDSTQFIGAWWIGMAVCAVMSMIPGFPLLLFPKQLADKYRPKEFRRASNPTITIELDVQSSECSTVDAVEVVQGSDSEPKDASGCNTTNLSEVFHSLRRLFTNLIWLSVTICLVAEFSIITGMLTYLPKYLEDIFHLDTSTASFVTGVVLITPAAVGIVASGFILQRLRHLRRITAYMLAVNVACGLLQVPLMFLHCGPVSMAGVTMPYPSDNSITTVSPLPAQDWSAFNLNADCNSNCPCAKTSYEPVCAKSGGTKIGFYNPCYAACSVMHNRSLTSNSEVTHYYDCSCMPNSFIDQSNGTTAAITNGQCEESCTALFIFLALLSIDVLLITTAQNATLMLTLQASSDDNTSLALGVQNVVLRLLASIPAPIYFGALFDMVCIEWSDGNAGSGRCLILDVVLTPFVIVGVLDALKIISIAATAFCWIVTHRTYEFAFTHNEERRSSNGVATVSHTPRDEERTVCTTQQTYDSVNQSKPFASSAVISDGSEE